MWLEGFGPTENYKYENKFKLHSFNVEKHSCQAFMNIGKLVRKLGIASGRHNRHAGKAPCILNLRIRYR
jgi:hypothetical protein